MATPIHKHLLIRAEVMLPPTEDDIEKTKTWMKDLIDAIDMKLLSGPYCEYVKIKGNAGITAVSIIETSHIALHVWDEPNPALLQLDVYTCGPFNPNKVIDKLTEFGLLKFEWKLLDRENEFIEEDVGSWNYEEQPFFMPQLEIKFS